MANSFSQIVKAPVVFEGNRAIFSGGACQEYQVTISPVVIPPERKPWTAHDLDTVDGAYICTSDCLETIASEMTPRMARWLVNDHNERLANGQ